MLTLKNWSDLEQFGIDVLTGESCAYSLRLLCDVSECGLQIIREMLGAANIRPNESWNGGTTTLWNGVVQTKTYSLMLPRDMFETLATFALLHAGFAEVIRCYKDHEFSFACAWEEDEEQPRMVREANEKYILEQGYSFHRVQNPGFSRNRHEFSGRTD